MANLKRIVFFLLCGLCNAACSHHVSNIFIPKKFQYPEGGIGNGKTFVYQNKETAKQSFTDLETRYLDGKHVLVSKQYDSLSVSDSTIQVNGETVESYNFFISGDGSVIKGERIQSIIEKDDSRLGVGLNKWMYKTSDLSFLMSSKEVFVKDTALTWQDKPVACLVTQVDLHVDVHVLKDTSVKHTIEAVSRMYYARGIGTMRFSVELTDHNGKHTYDVWDLVAIKDKQ